MFCSNCGQQLPDHVNFCVRCGFKVRRLATPAPAAPVNTAPEPAPIEPDYAQPVYASHVPVTEDPPAVQVAAPATAESLAAQEEMVVEDVLSPIEDAPAQAPAPEVPEKTYEERVAEAYEHCAAYYQYDTENNTEALVELYPKLKEVYDHFIRFKGLMIDPDYLDVTGTVSHLLARYHLTVDWDIDAAEPFADNAMELLGDYISRYNDTLDDSGKIRKFIAYGLSSQYAAYCAYQNDYYEYAIEALSDQPDSPNVLGIRGAAQCLLANAKTDTELVKESMATLEKMDSLIKEPAQGRLQESIFSAAYTWYATMLTTNDITYPDCGFTKDVPRAIQLLGKGLSLVHDERYTSSLLDEIREAANKY